MRQNLKFKNLLVLYKKNMNTLEINSIQYKTVQDQ